MVCRSVSNRSGIHSGDSRSAFLCSADRLSGWGGSCRKGRTRGCMPPRVRQRWSRDHDSVGTSRAFSPNFCSLDPLISEWLPRRRAWRNAQLFKMVTPPWVDPEVSSVNGSQILRRRDYSWGAAPAANAAPPFFSRDQSVCTRFSGGRAKLRPCDSQRRDDGGWQNRLPIGDPRESGLEVRCDILNNYVEQSLLWRAISI